jgi:hypothetical protein
MKVKTGIKAGGNGHGHGAGTGDGDGPIGGGEWGPGDCTN